MLQIDSFINNVHFKAGSNDYTIFLITKLITKVMIINELLMEHSTEKVFYSISMEYSAISSWLHFRHNLM